MFCKRISDPEKILNAMPKWEFKCFFVLHLLILLLFSNSMFGVVNIVFVSGQCVQNQKDLLIELKNNLIYDPSLSTKLVRWNESIDCCQWGGVKCDSRGRVTSLDLSSESISGGIDDNSTTLFKLEFLKSLNLAQNSFDSVQLPSGFGRLAGLTYLNLRSSSFYGQIPAEFSHLTRLVVLDLSSYKFQRGFDDRDLSSSYPSLNLENSDLKTLIHNFSRLRELYLDGVNISASGNQWCNAISSSLPDLRVLSLPYTSITGPFDPSLVKLQSLSVIILDGNSFSSPFPEFFSEYPSLRALTLSTCDLSGVTPRKLFQIKTLQTIDLSGNWFLEGSLPEFPLNGSLQNLWLSHTNFSGNVHETIGSLKTLSHIDLGGCRFSGSIPNSFKNLTQLNELDLSFNEFIGNVPSFGLLKNLTRINLGGNGLTGQIPDSLWEGLENLVFLDLSENSLEGEIPASLFVLSSLKFVYLRNNQFYGSIKDLPTSLFSLESLDLGGNNLGGPVPQSLFELHNLSTLVLSGNKFNGSVDWTDFQKLTNLVNLDLSYNDLSAHINENVSKSSLLPQLQHLAMASCKLQKFPLLKNQSSLLMLDLSDNKLNGEIPSWIWDVGNEFSYILNLSHNQFTSLQEPYNFRRLSLVDLHSNMLGGQIPVHSPSPSATYMDLSNNNFSSPLPENIGNSLQYCLFFSIANNNISGTIPPSLCNASGVEVLDLSNNSFHGRIPSCLVTKTLSVLNLRRNNLSGNIPDMFPLSCSLETLDLSWNGLQGHVPMSLSRCSKIEVLNLGSNNLIDVFPSSLKNLYALRVLDLHSNTLHGNISCLQADNFTWPNLQIINLASNHFNGVLPGNWFRKLQGIMLKENGTKSQLDYLHFSIPRYDWFYYQDSVTVTAKGLNLELIKIPTIFTSIDFSSNHFDGVIPETIGELKSLYALNLSHNALSGHIPSSLGKLQTLGSLDLSVNHLDGEIPKELVNLTLLSFLNLSYNELVGRIPPGRQLQTFSESSFQGNEGLCGFPLNKTCGDVDAPEVPERKSGEEHESSGRGEIYVSAAWGFLVGLGVIIVPLLFSKRWNKWFDKCVNKFVVVVGRRLG